MLRDDPSRTSSESRSAGHHEPTIGVAETSVFALVLIALILWMPSLQDRLDPLTGDEPFYVMTAISLIQDGDLDERNNYDNRDYHTFYPAFGPTLNGWASFPDPLPPHATDSDLPGLYSKHGLGMALLIAVPWHIGGRTLTLVVLALVTASIGAHMTLLARRFGASPSTASTVALLLSLTNPLLSFSLLIFPELTSALCIVYVFRRLMADRNASWQWGLIGVCAAALPWLHYRLAPVSVVFAIVAIVRFRSRATRCDWLIAASTPAISALALAVWFLRLYGSILPPGSDHAGFSDATGTLNGLMGSLFDQQWGALVHNPILILAAAAFVPFSVRNRVAGLCVAVTVLPYLTLVSAYRVWWGEWNPPARYLADVVPLTAAPLGWFLSTLRWRARAVLIGGFSVPALAVALTFVNDPQRMYNHPDGTSRLLETWSAWMGRDLTNLIPSFVFYSQSPLNDRVAFSALGVTIVVMLSLLVFLVDSRQDGRRKRDGILRLP